MDQTFENYIRQQSEAAAPVFQDSRSLSDSELPNDRTYQAYIRRQAHTRSSPSPRQPRVACGGKRQSKDTPFENDNIEEGHGTPQRSALAKLAIFLLRLPKFLIIALIGGAALITAALFVAAVCQTMTHGNFRKHHLQTCEWALRALSVLAAHVEYYFSALLRRFGAQAQGLRALEAMAVRTSEYLDETHGAFCLSVVADEVYCFQRRLWVN